MGKPAARMGDMTVHGGSILAGAPTVMIGGKPAARVGDMHVCPMLNPGVPPPPHVGAAILPPGCPTVMIGGMPAACVGDMVACSGPPDSIAPPGCPTVLIGPGGGGGGGGGAAQTGSAAAGTGAGAAQLEGSVEDDEKETHYLDVSFEDKGGFPISGVGYTVKSPDNKTGRGLLSGKLKRADVPAGNYEIALHAIVNAKWSTREAPTGDKVKLIVETAGMEPGETATLEIYLRDANFATRLMKSWEVQISGDKIEEEWEFKVDDEYLKMQGEKEQSGGYSFPLFYFMVRIGDLQMRSGLLRFKDWVEVELKDEDGNAIGNKKYRVSLSNGETRSGTLDGNGTAREENVPPGPVRTSVDVKS